MPFAAGFPDLSGRRRCMPASSFSPRSWSLRRGIRSAAWWASTAATSTCAPSAASTGSCAWASRNLPIARVCDIEACLGAQPAKLYHLGIRGKVTRSNLADANEMRDWRIYCEFAQALIRIARRLYAAEPLAVELDNTVYALDSTTIDLCLSLFPWAPFRKTKAAIKLHTLLDLRGAIPAFIFISDGKLHDVNVLDMLLPEPGAFYVMDRGYLDFERLYA